MIAGTLKNGKVFWQTDEQSGVAEPAILITPYSNIIGIEQEDRYINLNYDSLNEFIKTLKEVAKNKPQ